MKQTLKEAGYTYVKNLGNGEHLLKENESGNLEVWAKSINHAGYGLVYKNTHLEFCRSMNIKERLEYLRQEIEHERISYSEIVELQSLAKYIDKNDVLLLEWAGVEEK